MISDEEETPSGRLRLSNEASNMTNSPPPALIKFLKPYDRAVQKLALQLRAQVLQELAPCYENIYDAYSAVAIGYGSSDRFTDGICHIAVYAKHVNLGFNYGASLNDPAGVLQGTGKRIRHITIKTLADLARPEIRAFLRRAQELALEDAHKLGENRVRPEMATPQKPGNVVSVVKAVYPKKRRPG